MKLSKEELGKRIKEARSVKSEKIGKKYTGQMLANDMSISRSYLGDMESGRIYPNYEVLTHIAEICEVPLDFFQGDFKYEQKNDEPSIVKEDSSKYDNFSVDELQEEVEKLYPKIINLPQNEKSKLLKMINAYLEE